LLSANHYLDATNIKNENRLEISQDTIQRASAWQNRLRETTVSIANVPNETEELPSQQDSREGGTDTATSDQ
jgi:uncharacterized protein YhaN